MNSELLRHFTVKVILVLEWRKCQRIKRLSGINPVGSLDIREKLLGRFIVIQTSWPSHSTFLFALKAKKIFPKNSECQSMTSCSYFIDYPVCHALLHTVPACTPAVTLVACGCSWGAVTRKQLLQWQIITDCVLSCHNCALSFFHVQSASCVQV